MEDYTKFKLKDAEKLAVLLGNRDNISVIACNKCFKEFTMESEPECDDFLKLAGNCGKTVAKAINVDFLCNEIMAEKAYDAAAAPDPESIFVIACGLGIQTLAELSGLPVVPASDSVSIDGRHGMALTKRLCDACGQCYLNITGGVCPITDCAKSLLNGQCGGSSKGKCEVDNEKDCAWDKIYERLGLQGRQNALCDDTIKLRDYSKISFKLIGEYVKAVREKRLAGFYGGLHPTGNKDRTANEQLRRFPPVKAVVIPLSQHTGAPAKPLVTVGDRVKCGQMIGAPDGLVSSAIHASLSGTVTAVEPRVHPTTGQKVLSVAIASDLSDEKESPIQPGGDIENLTSDEIVEIIREKGVVGMGGAGFPTPVKLKTSKPIDTVLVNGCECEPLLTADHRVMLEHAEDIIYGLKALIKATGAEKGLIVVEDNKQDAATLLETMAADTPCINVMSVRTKYPQGAEKMMIKRALGRQVPSGGLPLDVGVVVSNVSTVKAVSDAIQKGMPLIERVVTVTGDGIKNPGNFIVKIGTSVKEILEHCGTNDGDFTIKLGGPMMGITPASSDVPVIKGTNGIIAVKPAVSEPAPCIRCGRCSDVCPMELLPLYYPQYADKSDWAGMKEKSVKDCIECACCRFICPSKIDIVGAIKHGKKAVAEMERK